MAQETRLSKILVVITSIITRRKMKVYPPGTPVYLAPDKSIEGHVRLVQWSPRGALYEIAWWDDGKRNIEWFEETEFSTDSDKTEFGFANGK